jgi:monovalent cation/hydrogen antiporter
MLAFETILVMLAAAVLLLGVARRWRLPYPVLLALTGAAVAIAPIDVSLHLDPTLVLTLFVAPVLLDAAYDTSLRDLKRQWGSVTRLVLIAVGLTTGAVALVVHMLVPSIPWAAAVTIGAIVAPPDAVAAAAVHRDVKLPHRLAVIIEGEALLNDASALLIYRLAVAAVLAGGSIGAEAIAPAFLLSLVGSVAAGPAFAWLVGRIIRRIADSPSSIIFQFVSTFGVWVIAERIGLSPILTVVTYAMTLARSGPAYQPAYLRIPSYAVWDTAVVVLNVFAFLLIGLELGPVIAAAPPGNLGRWVVVGAAVLCNGYCGSAWLDYTCGAVERVVDQAPEGGFGRRSITQLANRPAHRLGRHARPRHRRDRARPTAELSGARDAALRGIHGHARHTAGPGTNATSAGACARLE